MGKILVHRVNKSYYSIASYFCCKQPRGTLPPSRFCSEYSSEHIDSVFTINALQGKSVGGISCLPL